jgi:hypothetical protein
LETYVSLGGDVDGILEHVRSMAEVRDAQSDEAAVSSKTPSDVAFLMGLPNQLPSMEPPDKIPRCAASSDGQYTTISAITSNEPPARSQQEVLAEIYDRLHLVPRMTPSRRKNQCLIEGLMLQAIAVRLGRDPGDATREQWGIATRKHLMATFGVGECDFLDYATYFKHIWNFFITYQPMDLFWVDKAKATRVFLKVYSAGDQTSMASIGVDDAEFDPIVDSGSGPQSQSETVLYLWCCCGTAGASQGGYHFESLEVVPTTADVKAAIFEAQVSDYIYQYLPIT